MNRKQRLIEGLIVFLSKRLQIGEIQYSIQGKNEFTSNSISAIFVPELNVIVFNREWLKKARVEDIVYTIAHEMRHVYQYLLIINRKSRCEISKSEIERWKIEFENYTMPNDIDCTEYIKQEIEVDAHSYAVRFMQSRGF